MQLKYFILMLSAIACFRITIAQSAYRSCETQEYGTGACLPLRICEYFDNQRLEEKALEKLSCHSSNKLICCPNAVVFDVKSKDPPTNADIESTTLAPILYNDTRFGVLEKFEEELPSPPLCGRMLQDRIAYGVKTAIYEFPWTVLIEYTHDDGKKGHYCGGSLISRRWVLTAAHCVAGPSIRNKLRVTGVRLGEWNTETTVDCEEDIRGHRECAPPHVDIGVDKIMPHATFAKRTKYSDDIALLRLATPVTYTDHIQPICLPVDDELRNDLLPHVSVDVAGWGRTEHGNRNNTLKLKAMLTIMPRRQCQEIYDRFNVLLDDTQLCGNGKNGIDTCRGDSGSPMMRLTSNQKAPENVFYLVGVVSLGIVNCGEVGSPGIYTRVGAYIDWILNTMKQN